MKVTLTPSAQVLEVQQRGGLKGFIGWERLEKLLRERGEISPSEHLIGFEIRDDGLSYTVEDRRIGNPNDHSYAYAG